jgi:hypothetical protein
MQVEARAPSQPSAHLRVLVRRVIVDDQVDVEIVGYGGLNMAQEGQELLMPMARLALRDVSPGYCNRTSAKCFA